MSERCILLLGGSFDPVHTGHVGLARYACTLLHPDVLHLIPAGQPWQKPALQTAAEHRVAMLKLAFADWAVPVEIDEQEIHRDGPSYTIDSLRALRASLGSDVSLVLALGADQLLNLQTWHEWTQLFDLANLCFVTRPGFDLEQAQIHPQLASEIARRSASPSQLRTTPHGLVYIASNLALNVSSSEVRTALAQDRDASELLAAPVLDYIQQHHLYKTN